jgi:transcriptional regulator with XRE-family HTH domain
MITAGQMRAARALLGPEQRALAERLGLFLLTIQRKEASDKVVPGIVDSLMQLTTPLTASGYGMIGGNAPGPTGGGCARLMS